jgi:DNA polymerase-3 subunit delta'
MRVDASSHPDVKVFKDKSSLGIDAMRSLQHDAWLKPQESARKVYIIDDAGSLTVEACNSVLKILEDPPGHCIFILVCADAKSLPATVLSRCQVVPFRHAALGDIEDHLVSLGKTREEAKTLATASRGLLGQALVLADSPDYVEFKDKCMRVAKEALKATPTRALELAGELERSREDLKDALDAIAGIYRDAMVLKLARPRDLLDGDTGSFLEGLVAGVSPEHLCECIKVVQEARTWICRNANRRLALDVMIMRLADGRRANS